MNDIKISPDVQTTTGFMETCGAQIYYEWAGTGDALVLLHGGGLDSRMWDEQFYTFATAFKVIRYDVPACGKSTAPTEPFSDAGILRDLLKHLDVSQAHVLGNSLGGKIALDFAVEFPDMLKSLILVAPGLSGYKLSPEYMQQIGMIFSVIEKGGALQGTEEWLKHPHMIPAMENPAIKDRVRQMNLDNSHLWVQGLPEQPINPPAAERLKDIVAPTLLIVGDRDVADMHAIADLIVESAARAEKTIIPEAGHIVSMEKPEEFNKVVLEFLKRSA